MGISGKLAFAAAAIAGTSLALGAMRRRNAISFTGKSVVITGGRGLALEMARQLAGEGARLALLARDEGELQNAKKELEEQGAEVLSVPCDVRVREQVQAAIREVVNSYGGIDVLINNAGVIQVGPVEHMRVEDFENALRVHLWGPLYTMLEVIPDMRRRGGGRIVNVASIGGKIAVPHLLPYSTSKFALVGLSDGMRSELAQDNILVTTVNPGLMRTGSHFNAFFKGKHEQEFTWFSILNALPLVSIDIKQAAHQIIQACRYGDAALTITIQARLAEIVNVFFPKTTAEVNKLVSRLLPDPDPTGGDELQSGWKSTSEIAPSALTALSDKEAEKNNELRGHPFK